MAPSKAADQMIRSWTRATVSTKYQIVVPQEVRERLQIKPGDKVMFFFIEGRYYFSRVKTIAELGGAAKGIDTEFVRDREDRY